MIEIQGLRKTYGDKVAVHDLSLSVAEGEVFAFLGPNGAGKTTTIKILTGLLRADLGKVTVAGHDLSTHGMQARALMSYVPDEPYLYGKLTAREFLRMIGQLYRMPAARVEARIQAMTETFELDEFIDNLTEGYSHGMKQRTVIAAALLHEPRLLVIDEPMVGLDPKSARTVKDTLKALSRQQRMTVFMSTHTLSVAEEVADRIGILKHGKLVALGTLESIRQTHSNGGGGVQKLEDLFLDLTSSSEGIAVPSPRGRGPT